MKTPARMLSLVVALTAIIPSAGAAAATRVAGKAPAAPPPLSPRFQQVRDRIEILFRHRNATPPPLDPRFDPFREVGAAPTVSAGSTPGGESAARGGTAVAPRSDLAILQQAIATLKVSGIFEFAGRQHLVINSRPYKEGDVIQAQVQGQPAYLRVRQIAKGSVTLVLNEAELTLKF